MESSYQDHTIGDERIETNSEDSNLPSLSPPPPPSSSLANTTPLPSSLTEDSSVTSEDPAIFLPTSQPSHSPDSNPRSRIFLTQPSAPVNEIHSPETKTKKQRKVSTYQVFLRHIRPLFRKHISRVPMGLEASFWRAMPTEQRNLFTEDHVTSAKCQTILNSFVREWLANPVSVQGPATMAAPESDGSGSEGESDPATQEEPTSEIYWCTSLQKFVLYLPRDPNQINVPTSLPQSNLNCSLKKRGRPRKDSFPDSRLSLDIPDTTTTLAVAAAATTHPEDLRHIIVVDCLASTCVERLVSKSSLIGYQYDLVMKLISRGTIDRETAAFVLALVYFADWDDYDRESYMWTHSPVIKMIRSPTQWREWRTRVSTHECFDFLNNLFARKRSKLFCFFLCMDLLSLEEEIASLVDLLAPILEEGSTGGEGGAGEMTQRSDQSATSSSSTFTNHLVPLSSPQSILLDLLREVKNLTPNGLNSTFRRVSCRVGSHYQVDLPPLSSFPSHPLPLASDSELRYHPNHCLSNTEMDVYLVSAKKLIPIQSGYLIDSIKPTIATSAMVTSLVLPTLDVEEPVEVIEGKMRSYESHLKQLAMAHKLKPSLGLSQPGDNGIHPNRQLSLQKSVFPSDDLTPSSAASSSVTLPRSLPSCAPSTLPPTSMLVKAPLDPSPFQVPLSDCRPKYCWDDSLLEILHFSNYDTRSALHRLGIMVTTDLASPSSPPALPQCFNMSRWSPEALRIFFDSIRHPANPDTCNAREISEALQPLQQRTPPERYSLKDIISLYLVLFTSAETAKDVPTPSRMLRRHTSQYVPSILSHATPPRPRPIVASLITAAATGGGGGIHRSAPKRWPSSLRYVPYNLYWLKLSNTPCICLSLDFSLSETALQILPFSCDTPYKLQTVRARSLLHYDEIIARNSTDRRTTDFALALKDFSQYELAKYPTCRWYHYPQFLTRMLASSSDWRRWRMEVERHMNRNQSRRDCYFNALLADLERYRGDDDRTMTEEYPWDDEAGEGEGGTTNKRKRSSANEEEADGARHSVLSNETKPPLKRTVIPHVTPQKSRAGDSLASLISPSGQSGASVSSSVTSPSPSPLKSPALHKPTVASSDSSSTPTKSPKRVVCLSNLYWVGKIGRPCIYYGNPGEESEVQINVLPISVTTYQYDVRVRYTEISELTQSNLILCSDEKTREFAQALLNFYEWDKARMKEFYITKEHLPADRVDLILNKPYIWPDLILDLIAHREKWVPWSKGVEKRLSFMTKQKGKNMRCVAYFEKLREQYLESMEAQIDLDSGSESESDGGASLAVVSSLSSSSSSSSSSASSTEVTVAPVGRPKKKGKQKKVAVVEGSHTQPTAPPIPPPALPPSQEKQKQDGKDHKRKGPRTPTSPRHLHREVCSKSASDAHPPTGNSQNFLNLFPSKLYWYPKFGLPAIFYDDPTATFTETSSVCIYPISTVTSRYYLESKVSELQPLNLFNLSKCAEEKTKEFVQSLIIFYDWRSLPPSHPPAPGAPPIGAGAPLDEDQTKPQITQTHTLLRETDPDTATGTATYTTMTVERGTSSSPGEASGDGETATAATPGGGRGFLWPDFILNMISDLRVFNAFHRRAERRLRQIGMEKLHKKYGSHSAARIQNYFETLQELHHETKDLPPHPLPPPPLRPVGDSGSSGDRCDEGHGDGEGDDGIGPETEPELELAESAVRIIELTSTTPERQTQAPLHFHHVLGSSCDYPVVIASPSPQSVPQLSDEEEERRGGSQAEGGAIDLVAVAEGEVTETPHLLEDLMEQEHL